MRKVKLVKCRLRRNGVSEPAGNGSAGEGNVRYIPLEEFHLWRYYMEHQHGFVVEDPEISFWADAEALMEWMDRIAPERLEPVVEVRFYAYSPEAQTAVPVRRYLSGERYADLKRRLLRHYPAVLSPDAQLAPELREHRGYFVRHAGR